MFHKRALYYGFKGCGKTEKIQENFNKILKTRENHQSSANEIILILTHEHSFHDYKRKNLVEQDTDDQQSRLYRSPNETITVYLCSNINSAKLKEFTIKNKENLKYILYDDALIKSFDDFIKQTEIVSSHINGLILTVDPLRNYGKNEWSSTNFNYLTTIYNLDIIYLKNMQKFEIPFNKEQLDRYLNYIGNVLICQPSCTYNIDLFNFNNLKIRSKQIQKFQLKCELSAIEQKQPSDETIISYDETLEKSFDEIKSSIKCQKLTSVTQPHPIVHSKYIVFCLSNQKYLQDSLDYWLYIYCSLTKNTEEILILRIKENLIEDTELDDIINKLLGNKKIIENFDYKIIESIMQKYIEISKLNSCSDYKIDEYVFSFVLRDVELKCFPESGKNKLLECLKELKDVKTQDEVLEKLSRSFVYKCRNATEYEIIAFSLIKEGNIVKLKELFKEKEELIRIESIYKGLTMFLYSIFYGQFEIMKFFIEKGADVNAVQRDCNRDALQLAIFVSKNIEIVNYVRHELKLVENNSVVEKLIKNESINFKDMKNINNRDSFDATLFHYIAAFGNTKYFDEIKFSGNFDYRITDKKELTCFGRAVYNGHLKMLEKLLNFFDISLTEPSKILYDILIVAVFACHVNIIKWWFDTVKGYSVDIVNEKTLLHYLGRWCIKDIETYGEAVEFLVSKGGDAKLLNSKGNNVLMELTTLSRSCCVNTANFWFNYFQNGAHAYATQKNHLDQSLAHLLAMNGKLDVLEVVQQNNFEIDMFGADFLGNTPFMYAAQNGFIRIVEWLLDIKCQTEDPEEYINIKNKEEHSALDLALANNFNHIVKKLTSFPFKLKPNLIDEFHSDFAFIRHDYLNDISDHLLYPLMIRNLNVAQVHYFRDETVNPDTYFVTRVRSDLFYNNLRILDTNMELSFESQKRRFLKVYVIDRKHNNRVDLLRENEKIKAQFMHFINVFQHGDFKYLSENGLLELLMKYKDSYGATGLHLSAALGRADIIFWMYSKKFPICSKDKDGNTALYYAILNGHYNVALLLYLLDLKVLNTSSHQFLNSHYKTYKSSGQQRFLDLTLINELVYGLKILQQTVSDIKNFYKEFQEAELNFDKFFINQANQEHGQIRLSQPVAVDFLGRDEQTILD